MENFMQPQTKSGISVRAGICVPTSGKEGLPETGRPSLISVMTPNHPQKTHWFIPQDPLWDILFLRLEGTHLGTQYRVFYSVHDVLLRVKAKIFIVTWDHKGLIEVFKRLSQTDDLLSESILRRDDCNCNIGSVLSQTRCKPHDGG